MRAFWISVAALGVVSSSCGEDAGPTLLDNVPPSTITDLSYAAADSDQIILSWTAPGDDGDEGRATRYALRKSKQPIDDSTWDEDIEVQGLPQPAGPGEGESLGVSFAATVTAYFCMKSADEADNWSALSNLVVVTTVDTTDTPAPTRITDLAALAVSATGVVLTWTAPGSSESEKQAEAYDLRISTSQISEDSWASAAMTPLPSPLPPGSPEQAIVSLEPDSVCYYGLRARDAAGNWSSVSNQPTTDLAFDTVPPATTLDLEVIHATGHTLTLVWTSPGDDEDKGQAALYDLRYSDAPFTDKSWQTATRVSALAPPGPTGSRERHTVEELGLNGTFYFALKTYDESGNVSKRSREIEGTTISLVQLTDFPGRWNHANQPVWAPDGRTLAFTTSWDGNPEIYAMSAIGENRRRITFDGEPDRTPSFFPNGRLSFVSERGGTAAIWAVDLANPASKPELLFAATEDIGRVMWSRDGRRVVYSQTVTVAPYTSAIYTASPTGKNRLLLVDADSINGYPSWSPDGQNIAFASNRGGNWDIWIVPSKGGEPRQLTRSSAGENYPSWSPDGNRIAFASNRTGNYEIWTISTARQDLEQMTFDVGTSSYPDWSPNGNAIAFSSARTLNPNVSDVYVLYLR